MLPGKKKKIAIAIGSFFGASTIIAGVSIPIILKNKKDENISTIVLSSDFKKLEKKFDKIEKQLNIKQTSDFNLSTSSGQKIIKDHIFSLASFTKKEKEAIFLITKKGIISSKNRLEVVFQIKNDDQKKEYQFQVRHFSSDDEFKLYDLKQKINRYDLEEVIVIDQTKAFNQNLIKQTIIDEINKVNTKKLTTIEKNALSFNDKNISLNGIEEKKIVLLTTFGKEVAAYTFTISLQKPTDESNFLKLKNKFDNVNKDQIISQILDLDLSKEYDQDIVKNFIFSLAIFTKKEKDAISIITNTGIINNANAINVNVQIQIGSKKNNSKIYLFKLKIASNFENSNFINLKNKFDKINFTKTKILPILQIIDLTNENDRTILLNKIVDYVNNLNPNNNLNQIEKNALSIETKSGILSHDKITNIIIEITLGNKNQSYTFKILKLKNQDEANFKSLKSKFDKFEKYNNKNPILWKNEYVNYLYRQKFYDVLFQMIDEQNANNLLTKNEKDGVKVDFFSEDYNRSVFPKLNSIANFNVKIFFNQLKKTYRFKIIKSKLNPIKKEDRDGISKFSSKLSNASILDSNNQESIEIDSDFDIDLSNDSYHNFLYNQTINFINMKNSGNELTKKEKNSLLNIFPIKKGKKISFFKKISFKAIFALYPFNQDSYGFIYINFKRKENHQLIYNNLKNKFDKTNNREIILENELQNLLLSDSKIKNAIINKINEFNPNNSINVDEKQYIFIKNPSRKINYSDWTNVIVEIKVDSFKEEYTFKIKRKRQDEEKIATLKTKIEALNEISIKSKFVIYIIDKNVSEKQKLKPLLFQNINDQLSKKSPSIQSLSQEEKDAIKFFSYVKTIKQNDDDSFRTGEKINLKIGISFGSHYNTFILVVKNV